MDDSKAGLTWWSGAASESRLSRAAASKRARHFQEPQPKRRVVSEQAAGGDENVAKELTRTGVRRRWQTAYLTAANWQAVGGLGNGICRRRTTSITRAGGRWYRSTTPSDWCVAAPRPGEMRFACRATSQSTCMSTHACAPRCRVIGRQSPAADMLEMKITCEWTTSETCRSLNEAVLARRRSHRCGLLWTNRGNEMLRQRDDLTSVSYRTTLYASTTRDTWTCRCSAVEQGTIPAASRTMRLMLPPPDNRSKQVKKVYVVSFHLPAQARTCSNHPVLPIIRIHNRQSTLHIQRTEHQTFP